MTFICVDTLCLASFPLRSAITDYGNQCRREVRTIDDIKLIPFECHMPLFAWPGDAKEQKEK